MNKKTYFKTADFEDQEGQIHHITVAGIIGPLDEGTLDMLSIGVAICNPLDKDKYKPELGKTIAEGRANKESSSLNFGIFSKGMINRPLVEAILDRQLNFVINQFLKPLVENKKVTA